MAAKKNRWRMVGVLTVMFIYVGSLRIEAVKEYVHAFGSWCCSLGVQTQQAVLYPFHRWCMYGASITSLHERIDRLQKERDSLWEELVKREGLVTYGSDTNDIRSYAERYTYNGDLILAQCVLKEFTQKQHTIIVDKGSRHGVTPSMVAVYKNMLLGRVDEVQPWHSTVRLITDRLCKISAYCVKSRAQGIVEGTNDPALLNLSYISHLSSVEVGEEVLSSGQGLIFPRGFALGVISSCVTDGLYQKIILKPCLDPHMIDFCYLLEKGSLTAFDAENELPREAEEGQNV